MALVIVLLMMVLIVGIALAFFSQTLLQRQISKSSASLNSVDLLSKGAMQTIISDLKSEIVSGSTTVTVGSGANTSTLYYPATLANAVPVREGTNDKLPNLVKRSVYGTGRAANVSSTEVSQNGRLLTVARWNKPLLIPPVSAGDFTPAASTSFVAPDWILVDRGGGNPKTWSNALKWSAAVTDAAPVIGRYAYAIYNEGGLLDANVAGYPSIASTAPLGMSSILNQPSYKRSASYADLKQLGLTQQQVDKLTGWRNYATTKAAGQLTAGFTFPDAAQSSANYFNLASHNTGAFLTTANIDLNNGATDRMFVSRQQLIDFFTDQLGASPSLLQYFGTFSRALNQPSFRPDPNRPKVLGPVCTAAGDYTGGGNSAFGADDLYNPSLRGIRVASNFVRNDNSAALAGEPLLKKRFALDRIAWLTCNGPIANDSGVLNPSGDATIALVITQLKSNGLSDSFLAKGGPANIKKYFGLTWTSGTTYNAAPIKYWLYDHGISASGQVYIGQLADAAAANREPDFFEILKGAIHVGSLAKAHENTGLPLPTIGAAIGNPSLYYPAISDSRVDIHLMQLAANIIDCANPTQFPTVIKLADGAAGLRSFYGKMDLPYYNSRVDTAFIITPSSSAAPAGTPVTPAVPLTSATAGLGVMLAVPTIWNAYDVNSPAVPVSLAPSNLRITVISSPVTNPTLNPASNPVQIFRKFVFKNSAIPPVTTSLASSPPTVVNWNSEDVTAVYFSNPDPNTHSLLYREPTALLRVGIPAGSNLRIGSTNTIATGWSIDGIPETGSGQKFIGFLLSSFALQFNSTADNTTYTSNLVVGTGNNFGSTIRLEYQSGANWIPYQELIFSGINSAPVPLSEDGSTTRPYVLSPNADSLWNGGVYYQPNSGVVHYNGAIAYDPRSPRFGVYFDISVQPFLETGIPTFDTMQTMWPTAALPGNPGRGGHTIPIAAGWAGPAAGYFYPGQLCQNLAGDTNYKDPDGVMRRGMAGYVQTAPTSTLGLPLATVTTGATVNTTNVANRPIILHRPYRSVSELGHVFRDTPWKNIDFFTPQSGDTALLDVFCVSEDDRPDGLVAGKVDLNTRQVPVLQALLAGSYKDALSTTTGVASTDIAVSAPGGEAGILAGKIVARTSGVAANGQTAPAGGAQPLRNISEVVGQWVSGTTYDGFSTDIPAGLSTVSDQLIQRYREAAIRAFSDTGQVGTWNLMIDLVTQIGRYPATATSLSNFVVEGEQRYWLHVAIDRQTGQVIDKQLEIVSE